MIVSRDIAEDFRCNATNVKVSKTLRYSNKVRYVKVIQACYGFVKRIKIS